MKVLKRTFNMTKAEVELNIKLIPYHKKYLAAMLEMLRIRNDQSIPRGDKRQAMRDIRSKLLVEWKEINERISSDD